MGAIVVAGMAPSRQIKKIVNNFPSAICEVHPVQQPEQEPGRGLNGAASAGKFPGPALSS